MSTYSTKSADIKRDWYLFDAQGKILGRLATEVAKVLMGKAKPYFTRHLDCGDFVVVINAGKVRLSGKKEKGKIYYRHSGYPGGLKEIPFEKMRQEHPERIIEHAVRGMLPKNKLQDQRMVRLKVFGSEDHPYKEQKFIIHN